MKTVGIYLFDNVEVLDFAGPFEVFSVAQRLHAMASSKPDEQLFDVVTVAEQKKPVIARGGLNVMPGYAIDYHPDLDILIVPGGVVDMELKKQKVVSWIGSTADSSEITASVCTGAFLLAHAGVLDDKVVTSNWEDIDELRRRFPEIEVQGQQRWIDQGHIVTSAGISAGIDMSLHLVSMLTGAAHAAKTAKQMDYDWNLNP